MDKIMGNDIPQASQQDRNDPIVRILPTSGDSLWLLFYQDFVWKYDVDNFSLPYMEECGEAEFGYTSENLYTWQK
ncbi:MAG: hypothetical protein IPP49_20175 [Saprospiraceae bacterium]|nr:hypothetical protein [Saprospiraceae bacterium]